MQYYHRNILLVSIYIYILDLSYYYLSLILNFEIDKQYLEQAFTLIQLARNQQNCNQKLQALKSYTKAVQLVKQVEINKNNLDTINMMIEKIEYGRQKIYDDPYYQTIQQQFLIPAIQFCSQLSIQSMQQYKNNEIFQQYCICQRFNDINIFLQEYFTIQQMQKIYGYDNFKIKQNQILLEQLESKVQAEKFNLCCLYLKDNYQGLDIKNLLKIDEKLKLSDLDESDLKILKQTIDILEGFIKIQEKNCLTNYRIINKDIPSCLIYSQQIIQDIYDIQEQSRSVEM